MPRRPKNSRARAALAEADDALLIPELGLTLTLAEVYGETGVAPMRVVPPAADAGAE